MYLCFDAQRMLTRGVDLHHIFDIKILMKSFYMSAVQYSSKLGRNDFGFVVNRIQTIFGLDNR